jgi:carboxylate-amine ligase
MRDAEMPRVVAHVAGPDLVRGADGELLVLEDNMRAPSGIAYAGVARAALAPLAAACGLSPRPVEAGIEALGRMLAAAAPSGAEDARVVLVGDGDAAAARFEHLELAATLGLEIATPDELDGDGEQLLLGGSPVDVLYRRVDDERLSGPDGEPTRFGELLGDPMRSGTLACVNSPGSGVADDKAIHTRVEEMIGFYLDEDPLLRSVPGRWLGGPGEAESALERLGELVVKPRAEFGGRGVVIGPVATEAELAAAAEAIAADPGAWVAQEPVALSSHPTVVGGRLESRRVDLRPFVITTTGNERTEDEVTVVPGGLTRFARAADSMVVNSGQGGGAKDTWIL